MGNGEVTRRRFSVIVPPAIVVIVLASILTGVFTMPSTMSDGADAAVEIASEMSSEPTHLWDLVSEANPADDMPSTSDVVARVIAHAITAFLKLVNWAI
jgi:hypothetical protein